MVLKHSHIIIYLICLCLIGCSTPNLTEFDDAFELSAFLKDNIDKLPGQKVQFQILTIQGEPVPFALLSFQWVEGGKMSFQTDREGKLVMEFEQDFLEYQVMVSAEKKNNKMHITW